MDKTFNELFDEFFQKNNIKPEDKLNDSVKADAKKIIDILTKDKSIDSIDEKVEEEIDTELGKPDKIEFFNKGNVFFERRIWNTPSGDIVKLLVTDEPSLKIAPTPPKSLKQQLDEAVEAELFEKAAAIRDEMTKQKKLAKK
jgi:hypothetical protein